MYIKHAIAFIFFFQITLFCSGTVIQQDDCGTCKLRIVKIVKKQKTYFLYAIIEQDSSQIVIVSKKRNCRNCVKIEQDSSYSIKLIQQTDIWWPDHLLVFDVNLEGQVIRVPSNGWASYVCTSPDLYGLSINRKSIPDKL